MIVFIIVLLTPFIGLMCLYTFDKINFLQNGDNFLLIAVSAIIVFIASGLLACWLATLAINNCEYEPEVSKTRIIYKINNDYITSVDDNTYVVVIGNDNGVLESKLIPRESTTIIRGGGSPRIEYHRPKFKNKFIRVAYFDKCLPKIQIFPA